MSWSTEVRAAPVGTRRARHACAAALLLGVSLGECAAAAALTAAPATARPSRPVSAGAPPAAASVGSALAACNEPLSLTATRLTYASNHIIAINPDIIDTRRGTCHLTADQAEATSQAKANSFDVGNSHWVLTGHVHADLPQGRLQANTATVQILNNSIVSIMANGTPAQFQSAARNAAAHGGTARAAGGAMASLQWHGHADAILYDVRRDEVQLSGDSWLTDGCNDITSQRITYDIATQNVLASAAPGSKARVHGIIRNTHPGSACTPAAAPTTGAAGGAAGTGAAGP